MAISAFDKSRFVRLFNRGGYVLDFSNRTFDQFTEDSVGVAIQWRYGLSKGQSLEAYLRDADDAHVLKLQGDLLDYYETYYQDELDGGKRADTPDSCVGLYSKCREIIDRETRAGAVDSDRTDLEARFSSEYMHKEIAVMYACVDEHPTEAIGKAKELVESCCKTILENLGEPVLPREKMGPMAKRAIRALNIESSQVNEDLPVGSTVKQVLGHLLGVVTGVAELRNHYGSGHGRGDHYSGLGPRHARLAVRASVAFVGYLWDAYEWRTTTLD